MPGKNICIIGPPGSGKGSYGRHLAKALGIPLISSSDILRTSPSSNSFDLSSGKLIADDEVNAALLDGLKKRQLKDGFILDGFPRTLQQAHLMEDNWPIELHLHGGIKLAVPDQVCTVKLLGRRICENCGKNYNVNGVKFENWDLPPSLPSKGCPKEGCNPHLDWISREDDSPDVVEKRLALYHQNMDPILDYFDNKNRLLKLTPYKGYDDLPMLISTVQNWLNGSEKPL